MPYGGEKPLDRFERAVLALPMAWVEVGCGEEGKRCAGLAG